LYRQSEICARAGVELDRSTLADWVGATSHLLAPLVDAVHEIASSKLHADDTPIPVLAPGMGKTKGEHPKLHLSEFSGILQADGYAGFHHLYEGGTIVEAACWAHVRRKLYDIHVANGSAIAAEAIQRIGALYDIEREIRGKPADDRLEIRQARARPLMDDLHRWSNKTLAGLSRKSDTAVAIRYALSRWRALTRYLDDGRIEMDNSAASLSSPMFRASSLSSTKASRQQWA
jgi:transposase